MFRSLEENAAIVSALNLENIARFTGVESDRIVFAGGASKGALWCQILADVTGKAVKVPKVTEATALGGAFACGVATGEYASLAEAATNLVQWERRYEPDFIHNTLYNEIKAKFLIAYKAQLNLVDAGITKSMWKAPGL
jgi:autoinducer 2 (AI-2) kinase